MDEDSTELDHLFIRRPSTSVPAASTSRLPPAGSTSNGIKKVKPPKTEVLVLDDDDEEEEEEEEQHQRPVVNGKHAKGTGSGGGALGELVEDDALVKLDQEIADVENQIARLQSLRSSLHQDRRSLQSKLLAQRAPSRSNGPRAADGAESKRKAAGAVNYFRKEEFAWTKDVRGLAKKTWGIKEFRLCQEPAINAAMDGKDFVCVMPTGGGKSLVYQLPALLAPGTTLCITPLISLMQDQCFNLERVNVRAAMLHASTTKEDSKAILARLVAGAGGSSKGKGKAKAVVPTEDDDEREIKLIYVTPERIDKSKTFLSTLQKMYDTGLLSRIVIDEAHCTSSMGHDYRPAYLTLGKLKTLFPNTPISALTATARNAVVTDIIKILGLPKATSPGESATPKSTVLFSSPLYRPNLHYSVRVRPKDAAGGIQILIDYILENHVGESGIIYCLSRGDTESVSKAINEASGGKIRAAYYHAYIGDSEKLKIHRLWRQKRIHCVVATIAFGLGIDAPDVRYVLHHSLSKSLEGYYQESGRAGRDGFDSDCVIFYRSSDAARLSTLVYGDFHTGGKEKLYQMVSYAEDLTQCRKLQFASYFSSTHASTSAFEIGSDASTSCGHCDNCTRNPTTFGEVDVTDQVYRALRIIAAAEEQNGTLTLLQAGDLVRGLGGGSFSTQGKKAKGKGKVDVTVVAGGKVTLSPFDTESLLVRLLLDGYLREDFHSTAYATLSYLRTAQKSFRFTRFQPDEEITNLDFQMTFPMAPKGSKGKRKATSGGEGPAKKKAKKAGETLSKAKGTKIAVSKSDDEDDEGEAGEPLDEEWIDDSGLESDQGVGGVPSSDDLRMLDQDGWEVLR